MVKDCATGKGTYNGLINIISDPEFLIGCYEAIKGKPGNCFAPGTNTASHLDGLDRAWFNDIANSLRNGKFEFSPARRVMIPKPGKSEKRPLGIAPPRDKIVQKAVQVVLEAIWEPMFLNSSHGFRPNRSCHSALQELYLKGSHHSWAIQGAQRTKCFDSIPHAIIMKRLSKHVTCHRTLELVHKALNAGYVDPENGKVIRAQFFEPQGSVLSPLLCNIVLHELDKFMHDLRSRHVLRTSRKARSEVYRLARKRRENSTSAEFRITQLAIMRRTPKSDPHFAAQPGFRRLLYVRYADDFVILLAGTKNEAKRIRAEVASLLVQKCGLELNISKTAITHTTSEWIHFLGAIGKNIPRLDRPLTRVGNSTISRRAHTRMMIFAPIEDIFLKLKKRGIVKARSGTTAAFFKPTALRGMINMCHMDIIAFYQQKITGILNYYSFAGNRGALAKVVWCLHQSCALTMALKYKLKTIRGTMNKFGKTLACPGTGNGLVIPRSLRSTHHYKTAARLLSTPDTIIRTSWRGPLS
jgi:group II intron reverse transcriptase/maturase